MRAFTKGGSSRRQSSCSYCGQIDHQVNECPHAERDWASLKQGIIPLTSITPRSWYKRPGYWSDWYKSAETAVSKIQAAKERANKSEHLLLPPVSAVSVVQRSTTVATARIWISLSLNARRPTRTGVEWPINGLWTMVSMSAPLSKSKSDLGTTMPPSMSL